MYRPDVEASYRMALSRMEMAFEEMRFIRAEIFDCLDMQTAEALLADAVEHFVEARDAASRDLGFKIRGAMKT